MDAFLLGHVVQYLEIILYLCNFHGYYTLKMVCKSQLSVHISQSWAIKENHPLLILRLMFISWP